MRINHNILALNAQNNLKTVTGQKTKSAEKLSSGYRINRAADDAAGLAISEKMRRLIRGLDQGTENATDGISWSQSGDGALDSSHAILHRMTEITIRALNETNTDSDRMALEKEFEHLQSELDRISTTTTFNEINIFEQHRTPYYQCEGDVKWDPHQMHVVTDGKNDLTFTYRETESSPQKTVTINVPAGEYTTQELIDEIDDLTGELNKNTDIDLVLEFTQDGYCNANLEGGEVLDSVSGNMSYLLYQMFQGGGYGALIGTTSFPDENSQLRIVKGQNDTLNFTIKELQGTSKKRSIEIPPGTYTRTELIDYLNGKLADTTVRADPYGTGIRLASEDAIVTGFKGNMFKIDGDPDDDVADVVYNSVFYDNVKYGEVTQTQAVFTGGNVLPINSRDMEHRYYEIDSTNNELILQPNGRDTPVTLTIPAGKYTATQMVNQLNTLFNNEGLKLTASRIYDGGFEGIKIVSDVKGVDSKINMDPAGSAYDTLFVKKEYNAYGVRIRPVNETRADQNAIFEGSKDLSTAPLTIDSSNNSFMLSVDGDPYKISLTEKTYNNAAEIQEEIDTQLNGTNAGIGYKGKIAVSVKEGKIVLTGVTDQKVNAIQVSEVPNNNGFKDIFQGYQTITTPTNATGSGTGTVTLDTPFDGTIDNSENKITINVDGKDYTIDLPTGNNVSSDKLKEAIESVIQKKTEVTDNKFEDVSDIGGEKDRNFSGTANGTETVIPWSDGAVGSTDEKEGIAEFEKNEPAELIIGVNLKSNMEVNDSNNQITLVINNVKETITLENGTYTPQSLKNALQEKIDRVFGEDMGGAVVGLSGQQLVLTARLPEWEYGSDTSISCNTDESSFLKDLNTTRTAAEWTSGLPLQSTIAINDSNNKFEFQLGENGTTRPIPVYLEAGKTYGPSALVAELNKQLKTMNVGVSASLSGSYLCLTSTAMGKDVSISYGTASGGSSAEALFGALTQQEPANIVADCDIQSSITIAAGDTFSIDVNGQKPQPEVILDAGTYTRKEFVDMLNQKLGPIGVEAYLSGNKLGYKTTTTGSSTSLSMSYTQGGTSMKAIYGETKTELSGVKVDIGTDGTITLNATNQGSKITVNSSAGGPFQKPNVEIKEVPVSDSEGYHSTKKAYIDGVDLTGDVVIDEWNDYLTFTFKDDGTNKSIVIDVPDGTYTYNALQTELQRALDAQAGTGKITATVSSTGVRLEAVNPGSKNQLSSFQGDFYDKVICKATKIEEDATADGKDGEQIVDSAYVVGRKDVKNNITKIKSGVSDEFSLDLTYGNKVHTLNMKLDAGQYSADALKLHLQEKINEQLAVKGLPENLIEVGIGGVNTGVHGSNDQNALNFSISETVQAPAEGEYIIDGVNGNAAFEIFYQTDGSLERAYIVGTRDITNGVTIQPNENEMSFLVDGVNYDITIPEGVYTAEEFKNTMNTVIKNAGVPLSAEIENGKVKLIHHKMGMHEIKDVSGSAVATVFFNENGVKNPKDVNYVKLSSEYRDSIDLDRPVFNTCSLKINSVCISKVKYANKALNRIHEALEYVSSIRSNFGSTQNRLEHAIQNNENKSENTQYSESRIRDTDMAKEMVAFSNHNIISQAGQAMLAQANQVHQGVLTLLR